MTEAELAAELIGERLCPSAKVDKELREQLVALRPKPGEPAEMPAHLAVEIIQGDDERRIVMIPILEEAFWNTHKAREGFVRKLGAYFAEEMLRPIVIYLLSEAWVKSWLKGEEPKGPIDQVKREVVMGCALTIDGRAGHAMAEILRDDQARISGYGEIDSIACGSLLQNGESAVQPDILQLFFRSYLEARVGPPKCVKLSA